jgi:hypothetical protein
MNTKALASAQQRSGMRHATLSVCWGSLSGVLVKDSNSIIPFATLLGASEQVSLATTSLVSPHAKEMSLAFCLGSITPAWDFRVSWPL